MKKLSQDGQLNMDVIFSILTEEKPNQKGKFNIQRERIDRFFPSNFTEGRLRECERIMREKAGYDRKPVKAEEKRDCKHCPYFDEHQGKCDKTKYIIFDA